MNVLLTEETHSFFTLCELWTVNFKDALEVNKSLRKFKVAEHNLVGYEPLPFIGVLFMAPQA